MNLAFDERSGWRFSVPHWPMLSLRALMPAVTADGQTHKPDHASVESSPDGSCRVLSRFGSLSLEMGVARVCEGEIRIAGEIRNVSERPVVFNHLSMLALTDDSHPVRLGARPEAVVMLFNSAYSADIVGLSDTPCRLPPSSAAPGEPNMAGDTPALRSLWSENVWLTYDREARQALLMGFQTNERFQGGLRMAISPEGCVTEWSLGFDGGDLLIAGGASVPLEEVLVLQGPDPHALLERYAERVRQRHSPRILDRPPVSWCSWYPYRLSVSAARLVETARMAAQRLKPLGLTVIEADLGWEKDHLPAIFEPNARFPGGLSGLARQLKEMGFQPGIWKAPFTISEFDPLAKDHPDWLIHDGEGRPVSCGTWFWPPHGHIYLLDLTHPGALSWLQDRMHAMRAAGVRYFKADFIGGVGSAAAKRRHDPSVVLGGGTEARRRAAALMRDSMDPDALFLNCGGPEMPGTGHWPLLYAAQDTGNTGFINWTFQRNNFRAIACHLWKNRRWGIIQPSCLCVGLPGTLEEARLRATMAFLSGGQIDISDTLTTLGEDRWTVLEATLPPLGITARPIDLFDPVMDPGGQEYVASCKGEDEAPQPKAHPPGSVWQLEVEADWDRWTLVAFFEMSDPTAQPAPTRFAVPLNRLGLAAGTPYWAAEFWSGQFLGTLPGGRRNADDYRHPGDFQDLLIGHDPDILEIAFTGPAVKLLCLRKVRPHPWVVATSFHQSGGTELAGVRWDPAAGTLSGRLLRPPGLSGYLLVAGGDHRPQHATVAGRRVTPIPSANGAWRVAVVTAEDETPWELNY